jgi:hypothetical protein
VTPARPAPGRAPGPDILVATSADFALLRGGRPVAGGAWDDVVAARAYRDGAGGSGAVCLALRLRRGAEFVGRDDAPGWDDFVDAAESALPGMGRRAGWWPAAADGGPAAAVVLFERGA